MTIGIRSLKLQASSSYHLCPTPQQCTGASCGHALISKTSWYAFFHTRLVVLSAIADPSDTSALIASQLMKRVMLLWLRWDTSMVRCVRESVCFSIFCYAGFTVFGPDGDVIDFLPTVATALWRPILFCKAAAVACRTI
jgi:hypothetical protein